MIARVFGAGMVTDAFFVAFKLPNLLRRLFAEGAFSQACVVGALFDGLASTFAGLCAVGHEFLSLKKANALIEKPRFYR